MAKKKLWAAVGVLAVVVLLICRWMGRAPTEADDPNHSESGANIAEAAIVRVEQRALGNTLTIAGEFKPFQDRAGKSGGSTNGRKSPKTGGSEK